ncbi:hypothetical protein MMC16_006380 [Acarospora aff. strigata]|nr:hypothetical protein [Acarospora aff. strigata]
MAQIISELVIACLRAFGSLNERFQTKEILNGPYRDNLALSGLPDELGRLRIWTANIGAHQRNQSSLDYRLRDASHIRDQIIKLLSSLQCSLQDIEDLLSEPASEDRLSDEEPSELHELYKEVVTIINGLYQMSIMIRRPSRHDRLLRLSTIDKSSYETWDVKHVREKFPTADAAIVERLGRAITRRRRYIEYDARHHKKLGHGLDNIGRDDEGKAPTDFSKTIATEFEPYVMHEETSSNAGLSQTSYAPSLEENGGAITVPPPPKESANGAPFECPYCYYLITVRGSHSWARHVFHDLQPYLCVYRDCPTPDNIYESRHDWFNHELSVHNVEISSPACTLCGYTMDSTIKLKRHLARHLEELTLYIVPQINYELEDESDLQWRESNPARLDEVAADLSDIAGASPGASDEDENEVGRATGLVLDNELYEDDDKHVPKLLQCNSDADILQSAAQKDSEDTSLMKHSADGPISRRVIETARSASDTFERMNPASLREDNSPEATLGDSTDMLSHWVETQTPLDFMLETGNTNWDNFNISVDDEPSPNLAQKQAASTQQDLPSVKLDHAGSDDLSRSDEAAGANHLLEETTWKGTKGSKYEVLASFSEEGNEVKIRSIGEGSGGAVDSDAESFTMGFNVGTGVTLDFAGDGEEGQVINLRPSEAEGLMDRKAAKDAAKAKADVEATMKAKAATDEAIAKAKA